MTLHIITQYTVKSDTVQCWNVAHPVYVIGTFNVKKKKSPCLNDIIKKNNETR